MQEFINRTAVSLDSHLKIGLYNILPFPAKEPRQGSFIPTLTTNWSVPAGSSSSGCLACSRAEPPRRGHQPLDLIWTKHVTYLMNKVQAELSKQGCLAPHREGTGLYCSK